MNANLLKAARPPFTRQLAANIAQAIQAAKAEGVTSATLANLIQITRTPSPHLNGAPAGTNAPYFYRETFKETAQDIPAARAFLID